MSRDIKAQLTVFILDDTRSVDTALDSACLLDEDEMFAYTDQTPLALRARPLRHWRDIARFSLCRNLTDAYSIIVNSAPFELWILDNDLGYNVAGRAEEGYDFLKTCVSMHADKVPGCLVSCSANPARRQAIEELHRNWLANDRRPLLPHGV